MQRSAYINAMAIDMGERYLLAMVSNIPGKYPIMIPNTIEKSRIKRIRSIAKKRPSSIHEELLELNAYLQTRCQYVIRECLRLGISSIAIGNRSIKNPYRIKYKSLRDNPYLNITLHLVNTLRFECSLARVEVHLVDESFTSQIDSLSLEKFESTGTKRWRRKSRPGHLRGKSYLSGSGELIDRDINAAINIGRIAYGDAFADNIIREKLWDSPIYPSFGDDIETDSPEHKCSSIAGYSMISCHRDVSDSSSGLPVYSLN